MKTAADQVLGTPARSTAPAPAKTTPATQAQAGTCGVYEAGSDVRIFTDGGPAECQVLARDLSAGGSYWSLQPQQANGSLSLVCVMTKDHVSAEVDDSGGQYTGHEVCSNFLTAGWAENTGAEQSAANQASSAAADASSAAASAAVDQQRAATEADAVTIVSRLNSDTASIADELSSMATDVATTDKDLAATRTDAAQGPGDDCSNLSTVDYDAASTVTYDAQSTVSYDANSTLTYTFTSITGDISDLKTDLTALANAGASGPTDAASAITNARQAIQNAIAVANGYIDRANTDVQAAYSVAAGLATGSCSGSGPGEPPVPVAHVQ